MPLRECHLYLLGKGTSPIHAVWQAPDFCALLQDPDKQESGGGTGVEDETRMVAKDGK